MAGVWRRKSYAAKTGPSRLVEVGAAEEESASAADELAAAVFEARGAVGAEAGVVFGEGAGREFGEEFIGGFGSGVGELHGERLDQRGRFSTSFGDKGASK
jgi:hypothetical protein